MVATADDVIPEFGLLVGFSTDELIRAILARYYPESLDHREDARASMLRSSRSSIAACSAGS